MELELRGHSVQRQDNVMIRYKQFQREEPLKFDLLIDQCLFVEVKACDAIHPIHKAQLLSYMKLLDIPLGLIINFNELKLADGISRLILPGANMECVNGVDRGNRERIALFSLLPYVQFFQIWG